jgi:hypothetical protein
MSEVLDVCFAAVARRTDVDVVLHVESDLIWDAATGGCLIDIAWERRDGVDVAFPMVWAGENFYDVWAYRYQGQRFGPFPPFCHGLPGLPPGVMLEIESAGSCLAFRQDVVRQFSRSQDEALVGWCKGIRAQGRRIAVAPWLSVRHPA